MEILVVIDMQNDFIDGALKNDVAKSIVEPMADYIRNYSGNLIIFTRDTHDEEIYLKSQEGQNLPIPHCIKGTYGWRINKSLCEAAERNKNVESWILDKPTFGYGSGFKYLLSDFDMDMVTKITLVGTCTDICVISNALALKELYPEIKLEVIGYLCAGLTKEKHEAALNVMDSCQINVIR